jgi:hypothetical protein
MRSHDGFLGGISVVNFRKESNSHNFMVTISIVPSINDTTSVQVVLIFISLAKSTEGLIAKSSVNMTGRELSIAEIISHVLRRCSSVFTFALKNFFTSDSDVDTVSWPLEVWISVTRVA